MTHNLSKNHTGSPPQPEHVAAPPVLGTGSKKQPSYYGPLFWLALISFLVPLVVAQAAFRSARPATKPTPHPDRSGVDHALWDYLLKSYVANGRVDYDGMARDYLFQTYLREIGSAAPENLATDGDRLALLCNAYNALVIHGVITHKIEDSVMNYHQGDVGFFDLVEHIFAGQTVSLNMIEHQFIRRNYHDPRVHVALVCAARSCPAIRGEAYFGPRINQQLEDQARLFANNRAYVDADPRQPLLRLSPILKWYGDDWKPVGGVLAWLSDRITDAPLRAAVVHAQQGRARVVYNDYDWSLNSQEEATAEAKPVRTADFGSGSIPNQ